MAPTQWNTDRQAQPRYECATLALTNPPKYVTHISYIDETTSVITVEFTLESRLPPKVAWIKSFVLALGDGIVEEIES